MIIGVDLGGTNIRSGLVNDGEIISLNKSSLTEKDSFSSTIRQLINSIAPLVNEKVKGLGIGVPSLVDSKNGIVYEVANIPSWKEVALKKILEDEFHIPVFVNNDVNCLVLGEHLYGEAKSCSSIVALAMGTGLGAGIIINDTLYEGNNCGAGEVGSIPYLDSIFEDYTSSRFFEKHFGITAAEANSEAIRGEQRAKLIWEDFGHHLGILIQTVMFAFDPQLIMLGGSISKAYPYFEKSMREIVAGFPYPESVKRLNILQSKLENVAILGAAALVK
ncbi:MAG: ROK family protein [Bacteroidetes bacterium]|nr:ROK family protein [Bacteroidota bacterium]